jgi:uncharacterized membrane protein YesL
MHQNQEILKVFIQTFKNSWSKRNVVGSSTQIVIFSNSYNDVQNYQIQIDFPQ